MNKKVAAIAFAGLLLFSPNVISGHKFIDFPAEITANAEVQELDIASGNIVISDSGEYRITGTSTSNTITINSGCSPTITISDLNIQTTKQKTNPISISKGAKCTLIIEGVNELISNGGQSSAINVPEGATLIVDEKSDGGKLTAKGAYLSPAIGGSTLYRTLGTIIINGGEIIANCGGGAGCADIGVCWSCEEKGEHLIVIRGGNITAGSISAGSKSVIMVGGTINGTVCTPADEKYTVTIPTDVKLSQSAEISISDVTGIEENYDKICVKLSQDMAEGETFYLNSKESNTIDYNIKINGRSVSNESNIIEAYTNENTTVPLEFSEPLSKPEYPGNYSGTLTFTISVEWR